MAKVNSCEGFQVRLLETCGVNENPLYDIKVLNCFAREIRSRDPTHSEELCYRKRVTEARYKFKYMHIYVHVYYVVYYITLKIFYALAYMIINHIIIEHTRFLEERYQNWHFSGFNF